MEVEQVFPGLKISPRSGYGRSPDVEIFLKPGKEMRRIDFRMEDFCSIRAERFPGCGNILASVGQKEKEEREEGRI
ncbi:MAG: hypothetical protein VZR02_08250 [Lachnospiraceae bacterium]|nr:hypothetical protein [Lachnospiraceae bacterium]